jgi:hypothetical protein
VTRDIRHRLLRDAVYRQLRLAIEHRKVRVDVMQHPQARSLAESDRKSDSDARRPNSSNAGGLSPRAISRTLCTPSRTASWISATSPRQRGARVPLRPSSCSTTPVSS